MSNAKAKLEYFLQQADEESSLQRRIADFKKALSQNEVLEEFDRGIFESIIEKVIVGGYDENGEKDPYKITFIYKTGFTNEIENAKKRFGKSAGVGEKAKKMCSDVSDKVKDVAVIGLPDHRLGEIAAAIVELKEGISCTEEEVRTFCQELPRYKRPRRIIFDQVPRNPTGKIEKPVLREKYCGERLVEAQTTN